MMTSRSLSFLLFTCAALGACGDDAASPHADAGIDATDAAVPELGIAVVNSDYVSTSISLLDPATGAVANGDCINSGTRAPGATLALSGDVVLPSQPQVGGAVVAIDRTNSALTWIDPATCKPQRQLDVSTKFFSNPHDVISVSATKAYVLRYERNGNATTAPDDFDDGDDLLIIDPAQPKVTGRIALASYAVQVQGTAIQARAERGLLIDGKVYVTLANLSADFQTASHGRVLIVDPAKDAVTGMIEIDGFKNCGGLSYDEPHKTLVVACAGAFSDGAQQVAGSGVVSFDLAASPIAETRRIAASVIGRPIAGFSGIARDGALGFAVTFGEFGGAPKDQLWALDQAAGTAAPIAEGGDSFIYGSVVVDPLRSRMYLTDAMMAKPRVHIYSYASGAPVLQSSVDANPSIGLPPRELARY